MPPKQNQRYLVKVGRWQHLPQTPQILCGPVAAGGPAITNGFEIGDRQQLCA